MSVGKILLLGGTGEARALAEALRDYSVISSLAGRTPQPLLPLGEVRVGGFGGVAGMLDYLISERITAVIDATHPFAQRISAHAVAACHHAHIPRLGLTRPPWAALSGDRWHVVDTAEQAGQHLPSLGNCAFLALGGGGGGGGVLSRFQAVAGVRLVVRAVSRPDDLPAGASLIMARGPFSLSDEIATFRDHRIDVLVARDSGGEAGLTKLAAARHLAIPVLMIRRPTTPQGPHAQTLAEAMVWVENLKSRTV